MESFPRRAAQWLAEAMARVLETRGQCAIALSGGTTPRPVYAALAAPDLAGGIAWNRVDVYFGDERAVPRDDAESNYRMAMEALLTHVAIPEARVHRIEGERRDLDARSEEHTSELQSRLHLVCRLLLEKKNKKVDTTVASNNWKIKTEV